MLRRWSFTTATCNEARLTKGKPHTEGGVCLCGGFTDGQGNFQETEVSKAVYMEFCHFIKRERNLRRSDERHLEQSELTEETLCRRAVHKPKPVDDAVNDNIRMERLNRAIMELPEIQKRRFMLHFDLGLTYEQIGAMEGCTKMPIKRSIDRAIEKIRLALKNF